MFSILIFSFLQRFTFCVSNNFDFALLFFLVYNFAFFMLGRTLYLVNVFYFGPVWIELILSLCKTTYANK